MRSAFFGIVGLACLGLSGGAAAQYVIAAPAYIVEGGVAYPYYNEKVMCMPYCLGSYRYVRSRSRHHYHYRPVVCCSPYAIRVLR